MLSSRPDNDVRLFRYPRSPAESPDYQPNWRVLQVAQYRALNRRHEDGEPGGMPGVPETEDDDLVLDLHGYDRNGRCNHPARERAFFYAHEAQDSNARTGAASRMRALCVAGLSSEAIAHRMGTSVLPVRTYLALFFDVGPFLSNRDFVSSLVFPFTIAKGERAPAAKERLWLAAAFVLGADGLDRFLLRAVDGNPARVDETVALIRAVLSQDALSLLMARHADALPAYQDFDRLVAFNQTPDNADRDNQGKSQNFNFGLTQLMAAATEGLASSHPARRIVEVAREMSQAGGSASTSTRSVRLSPSARRAFGASLRGDDPLSSGTPPPPVLDSLEV